MKEKRSVQVFKIVLTIIVLTVAIGITIYLFPVMKNLSNEGGRLEFKQKIEDSGIFGMLLLFLLEVSQIYLFIVPGEPIEILAGMCYGGVWGTVFIMLSSSIISIVIFWCVRRFGKNFIYNFCREEKVRKIEESKLFNSHKKIEMILFVLFFLPGTPKDFLVYVSGILPIKPLKFILISTFARFPSVITSTLAGASIAGGNLKMSILIYLAIFLLAVLIIVILNKFDKEKIASKAIKEIK